MLDLEQFIELNEAFDSEPYLVQYDDHLANKEFYYFEEEAGKQYKIEISRNVDDDFGKSVRVLRIGYKSSGATYRRVITKFKDPKRVIATILSILNNYKVEGKYKNKTFAFAIQLTGEAFGSNSKLVKRIAKLYMRTQFNILDTDFTPSEHQYVYAIRKGKKVDDVFTGNSVPAGAMTGQAVVAEPETPAVQEPSAPTTTQENSPKFRIGDIVARDSARIYAIIRDVSEIDGVLHYTVDRYEKEQGTLESSGVIYPVEIIDGADPAFKLYTPVNTDSTNDVPAASTRFNRDDYIAGPNSNYYYKVLDINDYGVDSESYYDVNRYRKSDNELLDRSVQVTFEYVRGFEIYTPTTSSNAPRFAVGDKVHTPISANYVVITAVGNRSYTADLYYKSTGEKFHDGMDITFLEARVYVPYTAVQVTIPNVTQQPVAQATVQTPRFSVGQYIAKRLSDYYYEITRVESDRYILKAYKKATRRHNRRYDGYIMISRTTDYFRYSPTTGAFIDEPARTAPVAQPVAAPTGNFVREPNVLGDMTVSALENHNWYQAIHVPTRKDVYIFAFNVNQGTGTADFRVYVNNGDTMFDGQITRQNIADFIEVWRIAEAPVFNRTQTPHRFNVGDNVTDGSAEYKIDGFRGIFYIVANNTEFKPISNFDASYQLVGSQQAQATAVEQPSNVEGALTMAQHQQAVREAKTTYGITIGSDFIDKAMRHCPAVSAMDICKAMFGDSQDPDGGSRTLDWSGTTLTVTQRRGMLHGAPVQQMVRDFKFGSSERYVYHNYLAMAAGAQGGGATKKLFTESIPLYEKMGLNKVKVYANIQVGAAVWSKYGFKSYIAMDEYTWKNTIDMFKGNLKRFNESIKGSSDYDTLHEAEYKSMVTLLDGLKADGYFSDYPALVSSLTMPNTEAMFSERITARCDGAKEGVKLNIGKMLMWGNGFKGELDLSDRKSYNRMARYVGLPTR
jgi:hypothetical protein